MSSGFVRAFAVAVTAATLAIVGCGGGTTASSGGSSEIKTVNGHPDLKGKTIRFVVNGDLEQSKIVVAHAYDLLRSWGADVQTNYGGTAQVVMGAMVSGQADVLEFSAQGTLSAINSGVNVRAFALAQPRQDYAMIGRPNIKTLKDLKGAKIGVLDTVGVNGVQAKIALAAAGLTEKDTSIIQVGGQGARVSALIAGRIDATMVGLQNYLTLKSQGYNLLYSYTKENADLFDDLLWASPDWLKKNPDLAQAINEALLLSFRWFDDPKNKQAYIDETLKDVKASKADIVSQMYDVYVQNNMYPPNAILNAQACAQNQKEYVDSGGLPKELPTSQWVDTSFAEKALKAVGTAK